MHLFHWNVLLYLSFHLIGGFFAFASALGIPGMIDDSKPLTKRVMQVFNVFLFLSWTGIPILFLCSVAAFYLEWTLLGKTLSTISMSLGLGMFLSLVTLYNVK